MSNYRVRVLAPSGFPTYKTYVRKAAAALVVLATALLVSSAGSAATRGFSAAQPKTYSVAFASGSLPSNVDQLVASAGGTVVVRIPEIGGIGVVSANPGFATAMSASATVSAAEASVQTKLPPMLPASAARARARAFSSRSRHHGGGGPSGAGADPQREPDPLGNQQWDKMRMNVSLSGSYALNRGRPDVHVAFTDTGVDVNHPDISPNLDLRDSTSFVADPLATDNGITPEPTIQDLNGHGTWTASAVAAPINRIGISGVAPNVSIVELKTQDQNGNGLLLWFDQALVYAAHRHIDIVSASIVSYALKGDSDYILANRAVAYARAHGVLTLAAMGNDNLNLADDGTLTSLFGQSGVVEVPAGLPGVVGVSSTSYFNDKAFYSNYGLGNVDVAAPGGDAEVDGLPAAAPYLGGGLLIGAWSSTSTVPPDTTDHGAPYAWMEGTSMATPNAAGVAALIVSRYGNFSPFGGETHMAPDRVERLLEQSAAPQSCPNPSTVVYGFGGSVSDPSSPDYDPTNPDFSTYFEAVCQGRAGYNGVFGSQAYNGFFGNGIVDAVAALTGNNRR